MGRKTKITREMILEAAYELLDESGIGAVAIKEIAKRLGCSTQPVSWHFGSMTDLKAELYKYAGMRLFEGLEEQMKVEDALVAFFVSGIYYISLACDHPNVFRFTNVDDPMRTVGTDVMDSSIFTHQFDRIAVDMITAQCNVPKEKVGKAVTDTVIYTHGLAVMMMFDNFKMPKEQACKMIFDMGMQLLSDIGIDTSDYSFKKVYKEICK